ncbi:MAG: InlB B-repeat-containing protein [Eubacterium sp.]|nr:InlB B-repeat-containing protein [Eubacterium sp.]
MIKGSQRRRGRRRSFMALCLALMMVLCYNVPAFAKEYELNPDYENDDYSSYYISYDEDLEGTIVWAGDTFKINKQAGGPSEGTSWFYIAYLELNVKDPDFRSQLQFPEETPVVPIMYWVNVFDNGRWSGAFPGSEAYNENYGKEGTVRAWKITNIETKKESAERIEYRVKLEAVSTHKITYHVGEKTVVKYYVDEEGAELLDKEGLTAEEIEFAENEILEGWYGNAELTGDAVTSVAAGSSTDIDLYAKISTKYSITFKTNGGSFDDDYSAPESYTDADSIALPGKDVISKLGEEFLGWYDNADFTGTAVTEIAKGSTGDKVFYAKFAPHIYEIEAKDEYTQGSDETYVLHVLEADKDKLLNVCIGETVIDASKYTATTGSTVITFPAEYMDGLEIGSVDYTVNFTDGYGQKTTKILAAEEEEEDDETDAEDDEKDADEDSNKDEEVVDDSEKDADEDTDDADDTDADKETADDASDKTSDEATDDSTDEVTDEAVTEEKAKDAVVEDGTDDTESAEPAATNTDSSAKTGDNFMMSTVLMLMGISAAGLAVCLVMRRKKKVRSDKSE